MQLKALVNWAKDFCQIFAKESLIDKAKSISLIIVV